MVEPSKQAEICKNVYVIDEARAVRSFVIKALEEQSITVSEFSSGKKGLAALTGENAQSLPDLIIIETRFRDIDGIKIPQRLRAAAVTRDLPILVFSNVKEHKIKIKFLQAGADDFIQKPSEPEIFAAKVERLLNNPGNFALDNEDSDIGVIMVADHDISSMVKVRNFLNREGYCVFCTANSLSTLRRWHKNIGVAIIDMQLPDIDGLTLVQNLHKRHPGTKLILIGTRDDKDKMKQGREFGVKECLEKPIAISRLKELLEIVMEPNPPLESIILERQYEARFFSRVNPLPPVVEGNVCLTLQQLRELLEGDSELEKKQLLISDKSFWVMDSEPKASVDDLAPAIQEGRVVRLPVVQVMQKHLRDGSSQVADADLIQLKKVPISRTYDLGCYLAAKKPVTEQDIVSLLEEYPLSACLFSILKRNDYAEAMQSLLKIFTYLDCYFIYYDLETNGEGETLKHFLSVSFTAICLAQKHLRSTERVVDKQKQIIPAVIGIGGFFHDLGLPSSSLLNFDAADFPDFYGSHAAKGYEILRGTRFFDAVKFMVRDHHENLTEWNSRYDSCVRIIQIANDLDVLTGSGRNWSYGDLVQPSPEKYSLEESCLILLDRTHEGFYRSETVNLVLSLLEQEALNFK